MAEAAKDRSSGSVRTAPAAEVGDDLGPVAYLAHLRRHYGAATSSLLAATSLDQMTIGLRETLGRVLPQRFAIGHGAVISSSTKLPAIGPFDVAIVDGAVNRGLVPAPAETGHPIETVYATIEIIDVLTPDSIAAALARIGALRAMARRGKFYSIYESLAKPSGKTMLALRELRLESEPRTYLLARDVAGKGKWEKPEGLAKSLKEAIEAADDARLHGLAVLARDWFLYQPAYKKRMIWSPSDALLGLAHKLTVDLSDYRMHPICLDRYIRLAD